MPRPNRAVHHGPFPWLRTALEEWCEVIHQYCRVCKWGDVPWWHSERSAVGMFAAALTRSGWVVLQESEVEKIRTPTDVDEKWGRQDIQAIKGKYRFVAEAKNDWTHIPRLSGELEQHLQAVMERSTHDAKAKVRGDYTQMAVVFTNPKIRRSRYTNEVLNQWTDYIDELDDCARCWVLPRKTVRFPEGTEVEQDSWLKDWIFPGSAIIIRKCGRKS